MLRLRLLVSTLLVVVVLAGAHSSLAQDKKVETAARALQKKAMGDDYLATDFAKAKEKLDKAIATCGDNKCNANLRALLRRDLGTVLIVGGLDKDGGAKALAEAYKLDGTIGLDPDFKTKEVEAAWEKAKKGGGGTSSGGTSSGGTSSGGTSSGGTSSGGSAGNPEGDFTHTAIKEQALRTPVPIYVEYSGSEKLVKVIARYKGFGMTEWKQLVLNKMGENGWGAVTPCLDVQTGKFLYFIQGLNEQNEPIATAGDRKDPYKVEIKQSIEGDAPHLPGQDAPKQCADTGDCPPDFPGCHSNSNVADDLLKAEGVDCDTDTECKSKVCKAGKCTAPADSKPKDSWPRFWVGASVGIDFVFVPSATDVCKLNPQGTANQGLPVNDANYYCMDGDKDYPAEIVDGKRTPAGAAENANITLGKSDRVDGGASVGNLRLLASFDFAITKNIMVGARAGGGLINYSGQAASNDGNRFGAAPLHLEARGTYVIGKDALAVAGFAPYVFLAGGLAAFETRVPVEVRRTDVANGGAALPNKTVDAWNLAGPGFVALGGGARYAVTPRIALLGGLKFNLAFGSGVVPSLAPELGAQFGF
ncbi:MAG: hypothetical protein HOO96_21600 [Polyangiaceae bacterium]|nr:hypothetical protein [Polyangiaceae bacterium]